MSVRRRWLAIVMGVAVAVGIVGAAAVAGQRLFTARALSSAAPSPPGEGEQAQGPTSPAPSSSPVGGFVEFRDEALGIAISYPEGWTRLQRPEDPQVLLIASGSPQESFLMRAISLGTPIGAEQLPAMRQLTDQIVTSNSSVKLLAEPAQIDLGGLPGYVYFYSFQDPQTGQTGAHSHYFLFKDQILIALVFQALPVDAFKRSAPVFDEIAASFRVL